MLYADARQRVWVLIINQIGCSFPIWREIGLNGKAKSEDVYWPPIKEGRRTAEREKSRTKNQGKTQQQTVDWGQAVGMLKCKKNRKRWKGTNL